jgi:CheY-like chemotaxis protein
MSDKILNTLLYIDDDENLRSLVKMSLEVIGGYTLKLSASGTEALEVLKDFSPDIILLDLIMPNMNGIEVLKKIKMQNAFKNPPIILMTGQSDFEQLKLSKELAIIGIINKPFDPIQLSKQVQKIWNEHGD